MFRYYRRALLAIVERNLFSRRERDFERWFRFANGALLRWPIAVRYCRESDTYIVSDDDLAIHIGHPSRTKLFKNGLLARLEQLQEQYMTQRIEITGRDVVIDVGANIGEFTYYIQSRFRATTLSIEPEMIEFRCLKLNCSHPGGRFSNRALWSEDGERTFFSKNSTGDSSLVEPADYVHATTVRVAALSSVVEEMGLGNGAIKLLKLEAEGAEPEVLLGSREILDRVAFVSADVGPERGLNKANTLVEVVEILMRYGFRPVSFEHQRGVLLLENQAAVVK